ncbi:MAG: hypothetical protein FWF20_06995 [Betaproteobacteria bacterium]|nr:hypothetical protein [Betaproteobacteria bacterium]MCL2886515.1 hypothetical protein [Betaproteobacteria bacterium]
MNYAPLYDILPKTLHPTLAETAECLYEALADALALGESLAAREQAAAMIAREQVAAIARRMGGANVYFPKDLPNLLLSARDQALWSRFTGNNLRPLAREFGISDQRAWQIVKEQRRLERERRQMSLPLPPVKEDE